MPDYSVETDVLREALESLVLDTDAIASLESRFGGFNVFEAIGHVQAEERHSTFLGFLLDPQGSHGLDDFFIKRFIQEILKNVPRKDRSFDLVKLTITDLGGTLVIREQHNIDILAINDYEQMVIVVENKIKSSEHSRQLQRYREFIQNYYPDYKKLFIYLTPDGDDPSDNVYWPFSYAGIAELVAETIQSKRHILSAPARFTLEHYLEILRRHIVADEELSQLARSIYQKHKTALDYIFEQRPDRQLEISTFLQELVAEDQGLDQDRASKGYVNFAPKEWANVLAFNMTPEKRWTRTTRTLLFEFRNTPAKLTLALVMGPTTDEKIREEVYNFCNSNKGIFKGLTDKVYPQFMTLYSRPFLNQKIMERDNREELETEIVQRWDQFCRVDLPKIQNALTEEFRDRKG